MVGKINSRLTHHLSDTDRILPSAHRHFTARRAVRAVGLLVLSLILGCTTLPKDREQPALDSVIANQPDGGFADIEALLAERQGPGSGFMLLDSNRDALLWRLILIDQARYSVDLQSYLWYSDASAGLLTSRLIDAADRGVRVRLIIDDFMTVGRQDWNTELETLSEKLVPGTSIVLHDSVADGKVEHTMREPLIALADMAEEEILITNAYLIPTETGITRIRSRRDEGVRFEVLTNSLASHDVALVNSHYGEWRRALIEAGVSLHEMRPDAAIKTDVVDTPPVNSQFMGLHSKAVVVDRKRVFIGSMNFDPRSTDINTEMGVIIDSPELARQLTSIMERDMSTENSWRIELDANDQVVWVSADSQSAVEPARDFGQRVQNELFKFLPETVY